MKFQYISYIWPLSLSAAMALSLAGFSWYHRRVRGAAYFAVTMLLVSLWTIGNVLEMSGNNLYTKLMFANVQYFAYAFVPIGIFLLTLQFVNTGERWLASKRWLWLLVVPAITVALAWTDRWHGLLRYDISLDYSGPFPVIRKQYGPWFWVHIAYSSFFNLTSLAMLGRVLLRKAPLYREQALALFVGVGLDVLVNALYIFKVIPFLRFDPTPVFFGLSGLIIAWGLFRYKLFDLVPVARDQIFENLNDGIVVCDEKNRVIDINPAARSFFELPQNWRVGQPVAELYKSRPEIAGVLERPGHRTGELALELAGMVCSFEVESMAITYPREGRTGSMLVVRNVTDRRLAQAQIISQERALAMAEERERLARELHDSFAQVLGFVNVQSQAIIQYLEQENTCSALKGLEKLSDAAREAHKEVREYIQIMRGFCLDNYEFFSVLRDKVERFQKTYGIQVELVSEIKPENGRLPPQNFLTGVQIMRIVQEALSNIRKHSGAQKVRIHLADIGQGISLEIDDNGCGFNTELTRPKSPASIGGGCQRAVKSSMDSTNIQRGLNPPLNEVSFNPREGDVGRGDRYGLQIMKERAREIGARLTVFSRVGEGTSIKLHVPLQKEEAQTMTILLADDHHLFLAGLQNLLATRGYDVVATAGNGMEAFEKAQKLKPDIILMDIFMPECNGLEGTCLIKSVMPECKIVMLTSAEDDENLFEAIKSGASGYLLKSMQAGELFDLLASLERGEAIFSPGLAGRILKEFARISTGEKTDSEEKLESAGGLNSRQYEVLKLVAQGKTYKEVAADLGLSERTIKYHMGRILDILHVDNRAQVISFAAAKKMIGS